MLDRLIERYWGGTFFGALALLAFIASLQLNALWYIPGALGLITACFLLFYIIRAMHESKKRAKS